MSADWKLALEILFVTISFLLIGVHHVILAYFIVKRPMETALGSNLKVRKAWATIASHEHNVLPVQTLRNVAMVTSFLATTTIIVLVWLLGYLFGDPADVHIPNLDFATANGGDTLYYIKLVCVIFCLVVSFYGFSQCMRYVLHLGFLITVGERPELGESMAQNNTALAVRAVQMASIFFWIGMRGYYTFLPLVLWLIGPTWMLACTLFMSVIVYAADYTHHFSCLGNRTGSPAYPSPASSSSSVSASDEERTRGRERVSRGKETQV
eukprot:TRINITY_DN911_c0_g1_i2.p1 TRINITY_DN911_c0_g1~~TRINITY_DN911_c0_g1_i2.p1  ORF type:complete len:267 (+),score=26.94 TRINITY_DN911_c0_g1_i2:156-956(+)